MIAPRFHVEALSPGIVRLADPEARHARGPRRLSGGDMVVLFDGRGHEATGRILSAEPADVEVAIGELVFRARPVPRVTLAVALPKGPRQDMLIEKCTELGAASIQPLITERSIPSASIHRRRKWRRTTIEAAKQSGQCWLPALNEPRKLKEVVGDVPGFGGAIVAAPARPFLACGTGLAPHPERPAEGRVVPLITSLLNELARAEEILAFVGPEGGWSDAELDMLIAAGALPVSIGPNVLRTETAAIALAAAVHGLAIVPCQIEGQKAGPLE